MIFCRQRTETTRSFPLRSVSCSLGEKRVGLWYECAGTGRTPGSVRLIPHPLLPQAAPSCHPFRKPTECPPPGRGCSFARARVRRQREECEGSADPPWGTFFLNLYPFAHAKRG